MKKGFLLVAVIFTGLLFIYASVPGKSEKLQDIKELDLSVKTQDIRSRSAVKPDLNFGTFPLYFIFNKGQANKTAGFYARASRYTLWLTREGLVFDSLLLRRGHPFQEGITNSPHLPHAANPPEFLRDVSRVIFLNAEKNPEMVPVEKAKLRVNYFRGSDKSGWYCDVPTSKAVLYKNLYKNIDLKVYGIEKQIEYDWIVKPGGNPGDIRFEYKNVKGTRLDDDGNLLIETDFGELVHQKPVGYQRPGVGTGPRACPSSGNKNQIDVDVTFKKIAENTYGFEPGEYDRSCELVIDPVVLVYSTYLGGNADETGIGIAADDSGNAYVTGYTQSTDFPIRDQYQADQPDWDVFVTKIDTTQPGASALIYSSYLGGGYGDIGEGIAVDSSGHAYVTGYTYSTDFPTLNPYQTHPGDGMNNAFVAKIDTTRNGASSLIYSTYLGGDNGDYGSGIAVDSSGHAYVTGFTYSTDFPTLNPYQADQPGIDIFVTKIDTTRNGASSLIYSTYLGGDDADYGRGIAVDNSGHAYVTGYIYSTDFPTLNPYQADQPGYDIFVTKIDTTQTGAACLIYSTYLGGGGSDYGYGIAVDSSGHAYITGRTTSADFPTLNACQTDFGGHYDAIAAAIDTTRNGAACLVYSTYLGGPDYDVGFGITLDNSGYTYVTGLTGSPDFPTLEPYQADPGDNANDAFVTKIDTTRNGPSSLIYSTYLGGGGNDVGEGIAVDSSGNAYVIGFTQSTDFPTLNPYQTAQTGNDAFVAKFSTYPPVPPMVTTRAVSSITTNSAVSGGNVTSDGGAPVTARGVCWSIPANPTTADTHTTNGTGTGTFTSSITGLTPGTTYHIRAYAANSAGTAYGNELTFTTSSPINPTISGTVTDGIHPIEGVTITFSHNGHSETTDANGYYSYTVTFGTSFIVTPSKPGYSFTPSQYTYTNLTGDTPNQDFTVLDFVFVAIINPHNGDTVSGIVFITAEVSSTGSVKNVEFYIDGNPVKQDKRPPYQHRWNTTLFSNGNHTIRAKAYHSSGLTHQHEITVNVSLSSAPPHIELNRTRLNFGAIIGESRTGPQTFLIGSSGGGNLDWTASVSDTWLLVSPLSGTADMLVTVSVDVTGLAKGSYTGTITITDPHADNSPAAVDIYLEVKKKAQELPLFGSFDTPVDGAIVFSSVPFSGWALDDVEVSRVKIFRNPLAGHETDPVYIGDAIFVEGARPDVEEKYPEYPKNYRAGWGYMMLTNFLPNGGNGTFAITAIAADSSGNEVILGSKTIVCDNANAVKPFGAIDTPTQGGDASGADFINFGWALTPQPAAIPKDGSTIDVWVDGVPLAGHPVYNRYRKDIADGFPNYNNSNGAVGYYYLDTMLYANGIHTIAWSVTDNAGNTDGIGSRYFRILNLSQGAQSMAHSGESKGERFKVEPSQIPVDYSRPLRVEKGGNNTGPQAVYPDKNGDITIEIKELERLEIHSGDYWDEIEEKRIDNSKFKIQNSKLCAGYLVTGNKLRPLPIGSTFDTETGTFYWQPGPGFIGEYRFVFIEKGHDGEFKRKNIKVVIKPKFSIPRRSFE